MNFTIGVAAGAAVATGGIIALPFVLGAVGFTSAGIAAGSYAASLMTTTAAANGGAIAAGSIVAVCQSVAAAGLATTTQGLVVGVGSLIGGAASQFFSKD